MNDIPEMPQILASLDETVDLTNKLQNVKPDYQQLANLLMLHRRTLEMLLQNCMDIARLTASTKAEGEALTDTMRELFGKDSLITNYAEMLSQNYPNVSEKHLGIFKRIVEQIEELNLLQHELQKRDGISHVVNRQIEIIREIPSIFPEGAPIRNRLEKRIRLLR